MNNSDAAQRVSDTYNLHKMADPLGTVGKWMVVRLEDGRSPDSTLYDSKQDAVAHQGHMEMYCAFIQIGPWSMPADNAETFLHLHRRMYEKGLRMADPDSASGGKDMIRRVSKEDQYNQVRALFHGDRKPTNIIYPGVN